MKKGVLAISHMKNVSVLKWLIRLSSSTYKKQVSQNLDSTPFTKAVVLIRLQDCLLVSAIKFLSSPPGLISFILNRKF